MREKRRMITIRLSNEELENIEMASEMLNTNRSETIRIITRHFLRAKLSNTRGLNDKRIQYHFA